ncbi:MAG: hypothetical protein A2V59_01675 [Armatimonadetes bacterium RBG_19FT_COMBO_69_19]|nr:MAG: hypothetical protein A2V59_01675 [Armatimonadetes bacterium RBG_19FT_COMBO_69_19]
MRAVSAAIQIVRTHRRVYAAVNILYDRLVLAGMAWSQVDHGLAVRLRQAVNESLAGGGLAPVARVYEGGQILTAIALTLALNLFLGSLASITIPSLLLPFSGLAVGSLRAFVWSLIFSPAPAGVTLKSLPLGAAVGGLLLLEGQGYVLAMLAAWIQGRAWVRPGTIGAARRGEALRLGVRRTVSLYLLVALTLTRRRRLRGTPIDHRLGEPG